MAVYRHKFSGVCAAGDEWSYQWYADSIRDIGSAHAAAVIWQQNVWLGATAGNGYRDHTTVGVFTTSVITAQIDIATGKQLLRRETGLVIPGVDGGNALPADVALVVSLRTDLPQRTGRGRFYMPQPAASSLTIDGKVSADLVNDLDSSVQAACATYNTGVDRPVVYSTTFRVTRRITSFNIGDLFDTQRRRENKVKETRL